MPASSDDDVPILRTSGSSKGSKSSAATSNLVSTARRSLPIIETMAQARHNHPSIDRQNGATNKRDLSLQGVTSRASVGKTGPSLKLPDRRTSAAQSADAQSRKRKNRNIEEASGVTTDDSDVPIISKRKLNDGNSRRLKHEQRATGISTGTAISSGSVRGKRRVTDPSSAQSEVDEQHVFKKQPERGGLGTKTSPRPKLSRSNKTPKRKTRGSEPPPASEAEAEAEQDLNETYKWWENQAEGDGSVKWTTLKHNGVIFPPPYEPLPKNVRLVYDDIPVELAEEAEEVATFFGVMLDNEVNMSNPKFVENFFDDFKNVLKDTGGARDRTGRRVMISSFDKCDFKPIFAHFQQKRAERAALTSADKKALKAEKDAVEEPFAHCVWDGRREKVGNFRIEPPGLFRGRGDHPKTGRVKKRVRPEQITINIGEEAEAPAPPPGTNWKKVQSDGTVSWLAMWTENINGAFKYVMLAAKSSIKGQSDFKKFEKARELDKHIARIRKDYTANLLAELTADRQRATAMWLIDKLGLRAGNEKGEDEADTVGCCSLKMEHVTLQPGTGGRPEGGKVIFDFLGKDSIRFHNEYGVGPNDTIPVQVYKNLKIFKKEPKTIGDQIFDRLTTTSLNEHLKKCMPGLSAKVFRTYNASKKMSELLRESARFAGNVNEKFKAYNDANRDVAIFCNHKRTVGAGHAGQMEKLSDKVKGMKYQRWRLKQMMLAVQPKLKKIKSQQDRGYFELDKELEDSWIKAHQQALVELERQKITKRFDKDNEKLVAEGKKQMNDKELKDRLQVASELEAKFRTERRTKKIEPEPANTTIDKLELKIEAMEGRIGNALLQAEDKESNKEVALGTSKINYIDPRLSVVFSKRYGVPIERLFAKSLREKFAWAIGSVDADWEF